MTNTDMTVANEIRNQIGSRAMTMIGAKDLVAHSDGLSMRIGKNARGATHLKILLDSSDTYTVESTFYRTLYMHHVDMLSGVYVENLRAAIEKTTGLYTTL